MSVKNESGRIFYFDVLRTIACLSVILYHVSGNYVKLLLKSVDSFAEAEYWVSNFFYAISRLGVPLFIMISGALMLDETYLFTKDKLKKHVVRIVVFYVFWFVVYAIFFKVLLPKLHGESLSVKSILSVADNDAFHLWFCPMIIGLYLVTPLLKIWVNKDNKKSVEYFLLLSLAFFIIIRNVVKIVGNYADIDFISNFVNHFGLQYVGGYAFYYVLGWYLHNFGVKNEKLITVFAII